MSKDENHRHALGQYFTPSWAAKALVERHFPALGPDDIAIDPCAGDGRFLMGIPSHVGAFGVEIDPELAQMARANTGRTIITGDFLTAPLPARPTAVIGNPPFESDLIDAILDRCYELLDYDSKIGLILPVYMFQTSRRVRRYAERFSLHQEMIPRDLFPGIKTPVMFASFVKQRKTFMSGLFLYAEAASVKDMAREYASLVCGLDAPADTWRAVIHRALTSLGGEGTLQEIYGLVEKHRPSETMWWKEQIRKVIRQSFVCSGPGKYRLPEAPAEASEPEESNLLMMAM